VGLWREALRTWRGTSDHVEVSIGETERSTDHRQPSKVGKVNATKVNTDGIGKTRMKRMIAKIM